MTLAVDLDIKPDKFHVLRLLNPAIIRARKKITGDRRSLKVRKLLLMNRGNLDFWRRSELMKRLDRHPKLRDLYLCKEALHSLCRCLVTTRQGRRSPVSWTPWRKAPGRDQDSPRTLLKWRKEVLV
jgi:hypothetical protein